MVHIFDFFHLFYKEIENIDAKMQEQLDVYITTSRKKSLKELVDLFFDQYKLSYLFKIKAYDIISPIQGKEQRITLI